MKDIFGKEVSPVIIRKENSFVIRKNNLPSGVYFIRVSDEENIICTVYADVNNE